MGEMCFGWKSYWKTSNIFHRNRETVLVVDSWGKSNVFLSFSYCLVNFTTVIVKTLRLINLHGSPCHLSLLRWTLASRICITKVLESAIWRGNYLLAVNFSHGSSENVLIKAAKIWLNAQSCFQDKRETLCKIYNYYCFFIS